jgi:hypothetical protein
MFDSLDEQMKADERREVTATERYVRWGVVVISSVVLFAGLYYGVRFLE